MGKLRELMGVMGNPESPRGGSKSDWAVASRSSLAEGYAWRPSSRALMCPAWTGAWPSAPAAHSPLSAENPPLAGPQRRLQSPWRVRGSRPATCGASRERRPPKQLLPGRSRAGGTQMPR